MKIKVNLFGQLAHVANETTFTHETPERTALADVLREIARKNDPAFGQILFDDSGALRAAVMILVNDAPVDKLSPPKLSDGDSLTLIPAISGG